MNGYRTGCDGSIELEQYRRVIEKLPFHRKVIVTHPYGENRQIFSVRFHVYPVIRLIPVLKLSDSTIQIRQFDVYHPAVRFHHPPFKLFHRILRCHPSASCRTPAGSTRYGHIHAERISHVNSISEHLFPAVREIRILHVRSPGHPQPPCIELMNPCNTHPVHP